MLKKLVNRLILQNLTLKEKPRISDYEDLDLTFRRNKSRPLVLPLPSSPEATKHPSRESLFYCGGVFQTNAVFLYVMVFFLRLCQS